MFLETSAKTGHAVEEAFLKCSKNILAKIETGELDPERIGSGNCFSPAFFKHHSCLCEFKKMLKQGASVKSFLFLRNPIWWIFASKNRSIVSNKTSTRLCKHQIFVSNLSASSTYSSYFPFNMFEKLKQSDYRISKIPLPISGSELFSQMHKSSWRWVKWENVNRGTLKIKILNHSCKPLPCCSCILWSTKQISAFTH